MRFREARTTEAQALYAQQSANSIGDMRSDTASLWYEYTVGTPEYHSWAHAGTLTFAHLTDKADGQLAKWRKRLLAPLQSADQNLQVSSELEKAIAKGGTIDQKADKRVNHNVFGGLAVREQLNGHTLYANIIGLADVAMAGRDTYVNKARQAASAEGKNGDARKLGKHKQTVLAVTQILAVSPLAKPSETRGGWTAGRVLVAAGMIGGAVMSGVSGFDQIRHLRSPDTQQPEAPVPLDLGEAPVLTMAMPMFEEVVENVA